MSRESGVEAIETRIAELKRMDPTVFWVRPRIAELEGELTIARALRVPLAAHDAPPGGRA